VIFLRLSDDRAAKKIDALRRFLSAYAERLPNQFVVVSEGQVRFSK